MVLVWQWTRRHAMHDMGKLNRIRDGSCFLESSRLMRQSLVTPLPPSSPIPAYESFPHQAVCRSALMKGHDICARSIRKASVIRLIHRIRQITIRNIAIG